MKLRYIYCINKNLCIATIPKIKANTFYFSLYNVRIQWNSEILDPPCYLRRHFHYDICFNFTSLRKNENELYIPGVLILCLQKLRKFGINEVYVLIICYWWDLFIHYHWFFEVGEIYLPTCWPFCSHNL